MRLPARPNDCSSLTCACVPSCVLVRRQCCEHVCVCAYVCERACTTLIAGMTVAYHTARYVYSPGLGLPKVRVKIRVRAKAKIRFGLGLALGWGWGELITTSLVGLGTYRAEGYAIVSMQ